MSRWLWFSIWAFNALVAGGYTVASLFVHVEGPTFLYVAATVIFLNETEDAWHRASSTDSRPK